MGKVSSNRDKHFLNTWKLSVFKWHCELSVWVGQNRSTQCHVQGESAESHRCSPNTRGACLSTACAAAQWAIPGCRGIRLQWYEYP